MKRLKNVDDLAARLTTAATAPLQMLAAPESTQETPQPVSRKAKAETLGINLRPSRALYGRYVALAADRSKETGRVVSAQQIMLEVLERGQA